VDQGAQSQSELDTARNKLETAIAYLECGWVIASQASVNQAQSNVNQASSVAANQVNLNQKQVVAPIDSIGRFFHQSGRLRECRATLVSIIKK